jgi:hypothetical protein
VCTGDGFVNKIISRTSRSSSHNAPHYCLLLLQIFIVVSCSINNIHRGIQLSCTRRGIDRNNNKITITTIYDLLFYSPQSSWLIFYFFLLLKQSIVLFRVARWYAGMMDVAVFSRWLLHKSILSRNTRWMSPAAVVATACCVRNGSHDVICSRRTWETTTESDGWPVADDSSCDYRHSGKNDTRGQLSVLARKTDGTVEERTRLGFRSVATLLAEQHVPAVVNARPQNEHQ